MANGNGNATSTAGDSAAIEVEFDVESAGGAIVMDGKAVAAKVRQEVAARAKEFTAKFGRSPGLAVIQVGLDPASSVYVRNKRRSSVEVGIESIAHDLPETTEQAQILDLVRALNADDRVDGILIQLPLPKTVDANAVMDAVDPAKDVDGFHPVNTGLLQQARPQLRPCTPYGVIRLAKEYGITLRGAVATIVGRSNIVGKPMTMELLLEGATTTVCHTGTRDLRAEVQRADIVVAAVGKAGFVKAEWIKPGAAVFDVGINRTADGKLVGDVEYDKAAARAGWITPVPGGLGPMTIAMLLSNTVDAAVRRMAAKTTP
jgi:methylenetetrahydrofolate dehydrogenase (NADP+) / methenyltetrahydrofolate cyclohydrolase